ncbi:hypothetical protein HRbin12_01249 [bacterium HR12]|nr:hypothetical protein HRbin12_01249 [bacterium HR12]
MPAEERESRDRGGPVRGAERCDLHPMRAVIARCEGCGRPLCLACAIPVRGAVLGLECLPEPLSRPLPPPRPRPSPLVGLSLGIAVVATAMPWSRFGPGSGAFGAWRGGARWALAAAVAATLGAAVWLAEGLLARVRRSATRTLPGFGAVVALASAMAIFEPPAFTRPWIGPWMALAGGLGCLATGLLASRRAGVAANLGDRGRG